MALVRQGGQLVEVSEESLQQRLDRQTTSPAQAQAMGQTPKQQDMTGTPAQKKPILEQRVAKEDTLRGAERLRTAREQATQAEQVAADRAAQVAQLGSLGTRVQDLVSQQFEQAAQQQVGQAQIAQPALATTLGLSPEELEAAKANPSSNYNQVSAALNEFMLSADVNAGELALVKLTQLGLSSEQAKSLIDTTAQSTGKVVAESMADKVTLGQLDLTELGYESNEQLAELLGVSMSDLNSMTIPQLEQAVQVQQQAQFSRVANLKAEIAALPPGSMQREILLRELRDLGGVGVTGVEDKIATTVEEIDMADEVMIAGQSFDVEELLKDDQISDLIMDWIAADPAEREKIFPSEEYPELTAWIEANQLALGELSTSMGETTESFNKAQDDFAKIGQLEDLDVTLDNDVLSLFVPGFDPETPVTSEQLQALQTTLQSSAIGQIQQNTGDWSKEETDAFWHKVNGLSGDDKVRIGNMSADAIMEASKSADVLSRYQGMADFLGLDGEAPMMFDDMSRATVAEYAPVYEKISGTGKEQWLQNDYFGGLSGEDMMTVINSEDPDQIYSDIERYSSTRDSILKADTTEDVIDIMFDEPAANMEQISSDYDQLQKWAAVGDESAQQRVDWFKKHIDLNGDGKIDEEDFSSLSERLGDAMAEVSKDDLLAGADSVSTLFDKINEAKNTPLSNKMGTGHMPTGMYAAFGDDFVNDKIISQSEMQNILTFKGFGQEAISFLEKLKASGVQVPDIKKHIRQEASNDINSWLSATAPMDLNSPTLSFFINGTGSLREEDVPKIHSVRDALTNLLAATTGQSAKDIQTRETITSFLVRIKQGLERGGYV